MLKHLTCLTPFRCAPGYYGNPLLIGSTCKKCDCSGNSDPNLIFEDCDEITGQCRNCLRNTTGFKCERCAPGYYGDARIAKNCAGTDRKPLGQLCGQHSSPSRLNLGEEFLLRKYCQCPPDFYLEQYTLKFTPVRPSHQGYH